MSTWLRNGPSSSYDAATSRHVSGGRIPSSSAQPCSSRWAYVVVQSMAFTRATLIASAAPCIPVLAVKLPRTPESRPGSSPASGTSARPDLHSQGAAVPAGPGRGHPRQEHRPFREQVSYGALSRRLLVDGG